MVDGSVGESNELAAFVGPFWSETKTCTALALSPEELASRCAAGEALELVTSDGGTVYPLWQFQSHDSVVEVKPTLVAVLRALRGFDLWAVAVLLHTPSPELDGHTPLGWLSEGGSPEALVALAAVVAREWSAGAA